MLNLFSLLNKEKDLLYGKIMEQLKILSKKFISENRVEATLSNNELMTVSMSTNSEGKITFLILIGKKFYIDGDNLPTIYSDAYNYLSGQLLDN